MNTFSIFCKNTGHVHSVEAGTTLLDLALTLFGGAHRDYIACLVDNQLQGLHYGIYKAHRLEFVDVSHPDGMRTYQRSLAFLLQKACIDVVPEAELDIRHSVSSALFCELAFPDGKTRVNQETLQRIQLAMNRLVAANLPFRYYRMPTEEAMELFRRHRYPEKALLQQTRGRFYTSLYYLEDLPSSYYGPLAPSTGYIEVFDLSLYQQGFLLRYPQAGCPKEVAPQPPLHKLFDILQEHSKWVEI